MPVAAYAKLIGQLSTVNCQLVIDGLVGNIAGDVMIKGSIEGTPDDAEKLGVGLAEDLLSRGAGKILAEVYNQK